MKDGLWQAVLGEIELSVSRASYITWFKNTCLLQQKDNILIVGVPNVFINTNQNNINLDYILDKVRYWVLSALLRVLRSGLLILRGSFTESKSLILIAFK